ncbi:hypothetical protein LPB72_07280 [Hydrogenophaga crassostreae]|uniref:Recombinase family protein n=1 Tax=Hydrogenophaga crassostreae TaxID=1763535 RepID=A0A162T2K8_9BURK|nr:recombinase family protein [Hydrogenophaga crassostreae]AOW13151.1 hypothetical protein LPB072_10090 [Hydrogenophaga crassostreae]OAD42703.1 hypothetical protein LPB72_07280 [Hydrogenophaga crassostreae]
MRTAAYARYSTDEQRATSIDDQIRRCHEVAKREGLEIEPTLVFSDDAVSGSAKGRHKRPSYQRLIDGIDAGEIRIVVVDELSRLTRDVEESGRLMRYVENVGLQIIAASGLDTRQKGWQAPFMVNILMSRLEVEGLAHRATRGMLGQLERGYQIAQAPYGYRRVKDLDARGEHIGTRWVIDEEKAAIVREIFNWRRMGKSGFDMARALQERGVPVPMATRCKGKPTWLPATLHRLLNNTIYRGVFIWNGSSFTEAKARKTGKAVVTIPFERPECRIVSDELWWACNPSDSSTAPIRGGGKHLLSGLVRCGDCHAKLSVTGSRVSRTLYCPQCDTLVRVGAKATWIGYSSVNAAMHALTEVLTQVFTGEVQKQFHERLRARLLQGPKAELQGLRQEVATLGQRKARVKALLMRPDLDPADFEPELVGINDTLRMLKIRMEALEKGRHGITEETLQNQLDVDALTTLRAVLNGGMPAYQVRAVLGRLLASFELVARPKKGQSVFHIALRPGNYLAEVTSTTVLDDTPVVFEVTSTIGAKRPAVWLVQSKVLT